MSRYKIGIDLGGTKILALVVDQDGKIVSRAKNKTVLSSNTADIGSQLHKTALKALDKASISFSDISSIGIAVPSPIDHSNNDMIVHAPNIGLINQNGKEAFSKIFDKDVFLENDANCGIIAEHKIGAASGAKTAIGIFVGTGVGGGIIIDGKLHTGNKCIAGEFGHMVLVKNGRVCGCGKKGCVEAYCSKTAFALKIERLVNKKGKTSCITDLVGNDFHKITSGNLALAYNSSDQVVQNTLNKGARLLGIATASIVCVLAPEIVVFGGGVMQALGEQLMPYIQESFLTNLFGFDTDDVKLSLSTLGDDAVALGASFLQ